MDVHILFGGKKLKTIDPHSLLKDTPKIIENCGVMGDLFQIWKKLMSEKTDSGFNEFDAFVAGYFMGTNSNLREKYMKLKPREEFDLKFL